MVRSANESEGAAGSAPPKRAAKRKASVDKGKVDGFHEGTTPWRSGHNTPVYIVKAILALILLGWPLYSRNANVATVTSILAAFTGVAKVYRVNKSLATAVALGGTLESVWNHNARGVKLEDTQRIRPGHVVWMMLAWAVHPDLTLEDIRELLGTLFGVYLASTHAIEIVARARKMWWKRGAVVRKAAFAPANLTREQFFLHIRRTLDPETCVAVDEFQYSAGKVGKNYGRGRGGMRALLLVDHTDPDRVMFVCALTTTEVLPITLAVRAPITVNGWLFEFWCLNFLIPAMWARGKTTVFMDNARPHRPLLLQALFGACGIDLFFGPAHMPWYNPIEKVFLAVHARCSTTYRKAAVRAAFIDEVTRELLGLPESSLRDFWRRAGWV